MINMALRLREWLDRIDLRRSNIIAISRLSKKFEENAIAYIKEKIHIKPVHFFSFHLSLDQAASSVLSEKGEIRNFEDLTRYQRLIFLHDIEDVSSTQRTVAGIRGTLEKGAKSTVVLTMRPATRYKVYHSSRAPLYGRVVKIEEPSLSELEIESKDAEECGFLDLYEAYVYDNFDKEKPKKCPESASFNVLSCFWHFLTNDSRMAGSVRVVTSCLANHDEPMTNSQINKKCGIDYGRQVVHAASRTGLVKITKEKPRRAYLYPPLLKSWIRTNVPFYPV